MEENNDPSQTAITESTQPDTPPVASAWKNQNLPRQTALVMDHQNMIGQTIKLGLNGFDPHWLADIALRIGNCLGMSLVTDLAMRHPVTNERYLVDVEKWSDEGFSVVHVPARRIFTDNPTPTDVAGMDADGVAKKRFRRKDMTDGGIRAELHRWCLVPEVTHLLLFTHDVDFARELFTAASKYGKKTVLLTAGNGIAKTLANSAHETINVLGYASAYSALALDRQFFWHPKQNIEQLGETVWRCIATPEGVVQNGWLLRQLKDMQDLIRHLTLDCQCLPEGILPGSRRLSWRLLQNAIHEFLYKEKLMAGLDETSENPNAFLAAQQAACMDSLSCLMDIWQRNDVLLSDTVNHAGYGPHKQFYVNIHHPAVIILTETDLP